MEETSLIEQKVPTLNEVGELFPEFIVQKQIGHGGMGVVYLVEDEESGGVAALKILLSDDPEDIAEFEQEAHVMGLIQHPNVVEIYAAGIRGESYFIVMEYCGGGTLLQAIAENEFDDLVAANLAIHVCMGLYACHKKGVLHRDVKPENIMLDHEYRPKIADFGLAYCAGDDLNQLKAVGSPGYAAPEIWDHPEKASIQVDVYAAGAVLYTILTQIKPDDHNVDFNPLYRRDKRFILLIVKAMHKDPTRRFSKLKEMAKELHTIAKDTGKNTQLMW